MMKKLLLLSSLCIFGAAFGQQGALKVGGTMKASGKHSFAPSTNTPNSLVSGITDTLHYFYNKHTLRNSTLTIAPSTIPEYQAFYVMPTPYIPTPSGLKVTHYGSVFNNSVSIQVTGLESIVAWEPNNTSTVIPVTLIIATLNVSGMPVLPGLDSVTVAFDQSMSSDWIGGNFTNPVTVSSRFAVLVKLGNTALPTDTIHQFMNNAATPTSTNPVRHRYGEGLGRMRFGSATMNWATSAQAFGSASGADYEFLVAPRVLFDINAGAAAVNGTICTNSSTAFNNTTTPVGIVEHRQFNFNAFYKYWSPWSLTTNPLVSLIGADSTYEWSFPTGNPSTSYAKNPTITFNNFGIQSGQLQVNYKKSSSSSLYAVNPPATIQDVATATVDVSNAAAPVISIAGPTVMCSGTQATLTASGSTSYTWTTNPPVQNSTIAISPTVATVYSVSSSNFGCIGSQTTMVMVNTAPTVAVTTPTSGCSGTNFTMSASGANSYTWSNGVTTPTNIVSTTVTPVATFTVMGEKAGCPTHTLIFNLPVNEKPFVTLDAETNVVCSKATTGTSVALTGDPSGGVYTGSGVSNGKFTPQGAGQFVATYTYKDPQTGCENKATTTMTVVVCDITGLNEGSLNNDIVAFPNPAVNGKVTVINLEGSNVIAVYNILGSVVSKETVNASQYNVDLSSQSAGTYFMRITDVNGGVKTVKIVNTK